MRLFAGRSWSLSTRRPTVFHLSRPADDSPGGSIGPGVESALYLDLLQSVPVSGPLVITGHLAKVLVVMGTAVATLSFLGCCGACVDSACFLCLVSTADSI